MQFQGPDDSDVAEANNRNSKLCFAAAPIDRSAVNAQLCGKKYRCGKVNDGATVATPNGSFRQQNQASGPR